jgi:hypothetical protein
MSLAELPTDASSALAQAPARQLRWITGTLAACAGAWILPPVHDLTALILVGLALAALAAAPDVRAAGLALWLTLAGTGLAVALGQSATLGAVAGAGASLGWRAAFPTDGRDAVNAALAALALTATSGWLVSVAHSATTTWASAWPGLPAPQVTVVTAMLAVGLPTSFAVWLPALRHDHPDAPDRWSRRRLGADYTWRAERASELYTASARLVPDVATRRGLHEVATWVHRLQHVRQELDQELVTLAPERLEQHLGALAPTDADAFTRERQRATRHHVQRLHEHRDLMLREARRAEALVDYAIAFLEDARAGLVLGRLRPGADTPTQLSEVLRRLRSHAVEREAAVRTQHELAAPPSQA